MDHLFISIIYSFRVLLSNLILQLASVYIVRSISLVNLISFRDYADY